METITLWREAQIWDEATRTYKKRKVRLGDFPKDAYQAMVKAATLSLKDMHVATVVPTQTGVDLVLLHEGVGRIVIDRATRTLSCDNIDAYSEPTLMGMTSYWGNLSTHAVRVARVAAHGAWQEWYAAHRQPNYYDHSLDDRADWAVSRAVGASLRLSFGMSGFDFPKVVMKVLWQHLDREVASLALKTFGSRATFSQYTRVWQNRDKVEEALRLAPGVLGLWGMALDILDVEPGYRTDSVLGDVRRAFGLSPRAWRHLLTLKTSSHTRVIARHYEHMKGTFGSEVKIPSELLEFLGEVGVWPKLKTLDGMVAYLSNSNHTPSLAAVLRAGFTESLRRPAKAFWNDAMSLIIDWTRDPAFVLDKHQRNRGWEYFWKKQAEWHDAAAERARAQREAWDAERMAHLHPGDRAYAAQARMDAAFYSRTPQAWDSLLAAMTIDGVEVVPLTTSEQLAAEGIEQDHCVANYDWQCGNGLSRIFSLKTQAERSTLELARDYRGWRVAQNRGYHNGDIGATLEAVGLKVARLYEEAAKEAEREAKRSKQLVA